jgi:cysteinyl-tRNA synthetase
MKHLGEYMDIHCGGVDNIFPHHTNEIAQSESYLGHKWCNYWFHVHHLNDETGKMSKSKGEFLTVSLLEEKGYDPLAYRFFTLQSHYRKPLVFSYEALDQAANTFKKLKNRIASIQPEGSVDEAAKREWHDKFADSVGNDVNTAMGITLVYDVLKSDLNGATKRAVIDDYDKVLGLKLLEAAKTSGSSENAHEGEDPELVAHVEAKIAERAAAKKDKNFALADEIRAQLLEEGIVLKDTREGTFWERQ